MKLTDEQLEKVALNMFFRNMEGYAFDESRLMLEWLDPETSGFWLEQAQAVLDDVSEVLA